MRKSKEATKEYDRKYYLKNREIILERHRRNMKNKKQEVIDSLKPKKKFIVSYNEEVTYHKEFEASSEEELREKFNSGELEFENTDIIDGDIIDDSLYIQEKEK